MEECGYCNADNLFKYSGTTDFVYSSKAIKGIWTEADIVFIGSDDFQSELKKGDFALAVYGDDSVYEKINYCPMCGRQL
ncbi:hypothetical protein [Companilactobacillus metriopterae]|uniref:hypothetical protein n=1 Tax=Companilactobacillus metriopterae TaxID=1909267 RepID=UPI00100A61C7|nr:hypothetical protein [Companilactobacillus metriopterae]